MEFTLSYIIYHMGLHMAADYAQEAVEVTKTFLTKAEKPINHDLQRAARSAFLAAQQTIARECHEELIAESPVLVYLPPHREEIEWLDTKVKETAKQLGQLRRDKTVADDFVDRNDLESLCTPEGQLAEEKMAALGQQLVAEALKNCISPCYQSKVEDEFFERVSDHFMKIIRENPEVSRVFNARWLAQISTVGQEIKQSVQRLEAQVSRLSKMFLKLEGAVANMNNVVLSQILEELQKLTKDSFIKIDRVIEGSVILVLQGSRQGLEHLKSLFDDKKLKKISGIRVLNVSSDWEDEKPSHSNRPVSLTAWLQEHFFSEDWLLPGDLAIAQARTFSEKTERGIQLNLGKDANQAVILIVTVQPSQENIDITLWLYPAKGSQHLPTGLLISVLDKDGNPVELLNTVIGGGQDVVKLGLTGEPGERFAVKLALGENSVVKEFEI